MDQSKEGTRSKQRRSLSVIAIAVMLTSVTLVAGSDTKALALGTPPSDVAECYAEQAGMASLPSSGWFCLGTSGWAGVPNTGSGSPGSRLQALFIDSSLNGTWAATPLQMRTRVFQKFNVATDNNCYVRVVQDFRWLGIPADAEVFGDNLNKEQETLIRLPYALPGTSVSTLGVPDALAYTFGASMTSWDQIGSLNLAMVGDDLGSSTTGENWVVGDSPTSGLKARSSTKFLTSFDPITNNAGLKELWSFREANLRMLHDKANVLVTEKLRSYTYYARTGRMYRDYKVATTGGCKGSYFANTSSYRTINVYPEYLHGVTTRPDYSNATDHKGCYEYNASTSADDPARTLAMDLLIAVITAPATGGIGFIVSEAIGLLVDGVRGSIYSCEANVADFISPYIPNNSSIVGGKYTVTINTSY